MTDQDQDQDTNMLDAKTFSALPPRRQVEITAELLRRGDMKAIEKLGIKIMTTTEWAEAGKSDVIRIERSAD